MQFTFTYWDDTDNKLLDKIEVNAKEQGYWSPTPKFAFTPGNYESVNVSGVPDGVTITASFSKPFNTPGADFTIPNYHWTTTGAANLFGSDITIHLKHKIQNIDNNNLSQLTRTTTVNYINESTGKPVADPSTIDVYYTRTITKDLATGQTNYTDWVLDPSRGNQGYQTTANIAIADDGTVSLTPPTVAGYTPSQGSSIVLGRNGSLPSTTTVSYAAQVQQVTVNLVDDDNKGQVVESIPVYGAAGENADFSNVIPDIYKLAPGTTLPSYQFTTADNQSINIHVVHNTKETTEYQTRKVTVHYVNAETGEPMGNLAPDAQVNVFYKRTTTTDLVTNKTTTSDWTWDTSAKDSDAGTPGFQVVSGSWNLPKNGQADTFSAKAPDCSGYITVSQSVGVYNALNFTVPTVKDAFTGNTDKDWWNRNELTAYYVPKSMANKTVSRTINVTTPGATQPTATTQTVNFTRPVKINSTDTGVVFDGFAGSGWSPTSTTTWPEFKINQIPGYVAYINGEPTTLTSIPAQTGINADTAPVTIDVTYEANQQTATIKFVDDDENGAEVKVTTAPTVQGKVGQTINLSDAGIKVPDNYSLVAGQTYTFTDNANQVITVHLKHKTEDINDPQVTQTSRTATVKYIDAKTGESMGELAPDAKIQIFYKRTAAKDLVNNQIIYGAWQLDTSQGTNGYTVVSGNWSTPVSGNISVTVPTINGYTAYTSGNWSNNAPANEFSINSIANTDTGVEQTVYYAPSVDTISRTITEHFIAVGGDKDGQKLFSDAQLQIFFKRHASGVSVDKTTGKATISYINYEWDTDAKDQGKTTPGFLVISGKWDLTPVNQKDQSIHINLSDAPQGYTMVKSDGTTYSTEYFSTPIAISGNDKLFTNKTDSTWYNRNELTTYYVANSLLNKTITRTINIINPGATQANSHVQSVTTTRSATINKNDTDVDYSKWTTGSWPAYPVPTINGYRTIITQIVTNPDGTSSSTTLTSIPAQTVDGATLPTTVNITYTATATARLSGHNQSTYNGVPITAADLNSNTGTIRVNVNGPDDAHSGRYYLKAGDVEFSSNNGQTWSTTFPTNVNTYRLRLSQQGIEAIEKQFGNNSIKWVDDAGNSTITSDATAYYKINKAKATVDLITNNYGKVYDGQASSSIDATKVTITADTNNQQSALNTTGINNASFEWVDADGQPIANPQNVGTYYIKLTDAAFALLQANNPNYDLTNTGLASYTITQAQGSAEFGGNSTKTYDGQAITIDQLNSNGDIKVILNYPGAENASYTLKNGQDVYYLKKTDGSQVAAPTDAGDYWVYLTDQGKQDIIAEMQRLTGHGQNDQANVKLTANDITGTASLTISAAKNVISVGNKQTSPYTGQPINIVYTPDGTNSVTVTVINSDGAKADLSQIKLTADDFTVTNANGQTGNAINAGDYQVVLNDKGIAAIQAAVGSNYVISQASTAHGTLTITPIQAEVKFQGQAHKTYDGQPVPDYLSHYTLTLNIPGHANYPLRNGDLEFSTDGQNWSSTAPSDHGNYQVRLSYLGRLHVNNFVSQYAGNNIIGWTAAIQNAGTGTYVIDQAQATIRLQGKNSKFYNGKATTLTEITSNGSISIQITSSLDSVPKSMALLTGDYEWLNASGQVITAPTDIGSYQLRLTPAGINRVQAFISNNGNVVIEQTADYGTADFNIDQAVVKNLQLEGKLHAVYNGQAVSFDPTDPETKKNIVFNNANGLIIPTFNQEDFTWYDAKDNKLTAAPKDAGTYYLQLNARGQQKLINANPNYSFVDENGKFALTGHIVYTVDKVDLAVTVSGQAAKVYDGQTAVITQEQLNGGNIKLMWNNTLIQPSDLGKLNLTPADFEVVDASGHAATNANASANVHVGTPEYFVRLSVAGQQKLQTLSGIDNYNLSINSKATYLIYTRKAQVTLTGNQTTPYGDKLPLNAKEYHAELSNWTDTTAPKPTIGTLQDGDVYIEGYEDGSLPVDVGSYQVKISNQLLERLKKAYPDYDFTVDSTKVGGSVEAEHDPATYVITPAVTTVTIHGAQHVKYGQDTTIKYGTDGYTVSIIRNATEQTPTPQTITDKIQLPANYLEFVSEPGNVGPYQVKLTASALAYLKKNYPNYNWDQAQDAYASFYVDQMPISISVNNTQTVTYGSPDWLQAIKNMPNGFALNIIDDDGKAITGVTLKAGDLAYLTKPGNVGNYQVVLTAQGLQDIKDQLGTNYSYPQTANDVTSNAQLVIEKGNITVSMNGSWTKQFGEDITPSAGQLNYGTLVIYTPDGQAHTVEVQPDDIAFNDNQSPHNVGQYQAVISEKGKQRLEQLAGNNGQNYNWTWGSTASLTISPATGAAVLSGQNGKVYDKQPVTTIEINNDGKIIVKLTYTVNGQVQQLGNYTLQDGDYTWLDNQGKEIAAPTKVGKYQIKLNPTSILDHLQARLNEKEVAGTGQNGQSNVVITEAGLSGTAKFDISQAQAKITITGTQTSTDPKAQLDPKNFKLTTSDPQIKIPADLAYELVNGVPTKAGKYQVRLTADSLKQLQADNPDYALEINDDQAVFNLQATLNIIFQDSQNNNAQVGKTIVKNGDANTWIGLNDVKLPDNYVLAPGQASLPAGYTFTDALTTNMIIKLVHAKQELAPETKTITRTINISEPGKKKQTIVQKATVTRSMIKDLVTGQISYGSWSTASWPGYTLAKLPHYQVKIEQTVNGQTTKLEAIDPVTVTVDTPSAVVNVTYVKQSKPKPDKPHKPHKPAKPNKPNRPSKPTVPNIPGSQRLPDGTIVGPHGEVYYKNGRWTRVGLYDLPQTSSKDQSLAAVTGGLLSSLGFLSLL